jgi:hypothetical protein
MGIVNGLVLIILGALCIPALVAEKSPKAKELLDKIVPFQGIVGVVAFVWGVVALIQCVIGLSLFALGLRGIIQWITMLASAALLLCTGAILGWALIQKHLLEKASDSVKAKAEESFAKIAALQPKIGLASIIFGAWAIISAIIF